MTTSIEARLAEIAARYRAMERDRPRVSIAALRVAELRRIFRAAMATSSPTTTLVATTPCLWLTIWHTAPAILPAGLLLGWRAQRRG